MTLTAIIDWVKQNPETFAAILIYILVNVAPRKHPEEQSGLAKYFWLLLDRLAVLTHEKLPGKLKLPMTASPRATTQDKDKDSS